MRVCARFFFLRLCSLLLVIYNSHTYICTHNRISLSITLSTGKSLMDKPEKKVTHSLSCCTLLSLSLSLLRSPNLKWRHTRPSEALHGAPMTVRVCHSPSPSLSLSLSLSLSNAHLSSIIRAWRLDVAL
jgi:hypothetical protein